MTDEDFRARAAWRSATVAAALNLFGMPAELAISRTTPGFPAWPALISMACAVVLLGVLLAVRRQPSVALGNAVFLLNVGAILAALWFINVAAASSGRPWVPFQENKLGMVTVALLAPELWVGVVSVAAYVTAALVQFTELEPVARGHLALGEPWATIAIASFSAVLLAYRVKRHLLEREVARANARTEATEELARVLLAVRDLANTPLQTIAFAAATAREAHPDLVPTMERVDRSLDKLRTLDRRLSQHDAELRWTAREESLDALLAIRATRTSRR